MKVVKPTNVTQLTASSVSYDLGNNYAGVPRVTLPAGVPAGHQMTIAVTEYPAEAGAPGKATTYGQQDTYTFSGTTPCIINYSRTRFCSLPSAPNYRSTAATCLSRSLNHFR